MDFVNRSYGQAAELLRSMTPAARITTGLLLAVILISLAFLFRQRAEVADEFLFGGEHLSQAQIAAMEAAFSSKGLNEWETVGNRIRVPRRKRNFYIEAARTAEAMPAAPETAWQQLFSGDNPLKSTQIRAWEAFRAQERTLALTLEELAGVDRAVVQIQEVDTGGFPRRKERRCLVSVKATGSRALPAALVESVRHMVVSGGGVDPQHVTVSDLNTGQTYPGLGENGLLADSLYAKRQREQEEIYRAKILDRLSTYGDVKVAVHVELDKEMVNQTVSDKYDPKATTVETTDFSKEITSTRPDPGGRPGVVPNASIGNVAQQVSPGGVESSTTERRENQRFVTGATRTITEKVPFVPTWIGVSIGVPRSYFQRIWLQRNPAAAGQDAVTPDVGELKSIENEIVKDIEEAVKTLLPKAIPGEDLDQRVAVVPYTETPLPEPAGPSVSDKALTWLSSHWQTLGLLLLAVFSILFLKSMIRSTPEPVRTPGEPAIAVATGSSEDEEKPDDVVAISNSLRQRFQGSGRNLRDELTELVREDPEAAASVLQSWIGDAA